MYLLCSDGLTGMISDDEIAAILRADGQRSTRRPRRSCAPPTRAAGRDNITVVLFRVAEDEAAAEPTRTRSRARRRSHQGLTADDVQAAVSEQERAGAPGAGAGTLPKAAAASRAPAPAPRRRSRLRRLLAASWRPARGRGRGRPAAVLGARQVYFVGTDDAGLVTLYRGLPYDLPLGVELYSEQYASSVPARTIGRGAARAACSTTSGAAVDDAEDLVRQLERGTLDLGGRSR